MGATNTTTHYNLSQFISTDKPAWLQDYNGDMLKIDTAIDAAKVAADTAQTTANAASGASTQNANDIAALSTDVSGQGANITALQLAVNTINSLIGNGTPTTTDQTIIGAINEINAKVNNDLKPHKIAESGTASATNRTKLQSLASAISNWLNSNPSQEASLKIKLVSSDGVSILFNFDINRNNNIYAFSRTTIGVGASTTFSVSELAISSTASSCFYKDADVNVTPSQTYQSFTDLSENTVTYNYEVWVC